MHISEFSPHEIAALTRILQLHPGEDGITHSIRVMSAISALPSNLKRPRVLPLLMLPSQKSCTHLCALHKLLHAPAVHALFTLLTLEVGSRLNSLMANRDLFSTGQESRLSALREVQALWLSPELYEKTFPHSAAPTNWHHRPDECEACMLARIGGDIKTLLDLRMVLLSRLSSKRLRSSGPPRLMGWVEGWIASLTMVNMSQSDFETTICNNDKDGEELKMVRKQIWFESRDRKRQGRRSLVSTDPPSIPYTDQSKICRSGAPSTGLTQKTSRRQSEGAVVRPGPTHFGPGAFTAGLLKVGCSSSSSTIAVPQSRATSNTATSSSTYVADSQTNSARASSPSSYAEPLFAHHHAWIPGSAEQNARRYQTLLSPLASPLLPRRSSQRPGSDQGPQTLPVRPRSKESTPGWDAQSEAQVSTAETGSTVLTKWSSFCYPGREGGWI